MIYGREYEFLLDFGGFDYLCEGFWLVDGQFSQNFAVQGNTGSFETSDQTAVCRTIQTSGSVDACIPQGAEGALAVAAIAVRELQAFGDGLFAAFDTDAVRVAEAFSSFTDFDVLGMSRHSSFNSHR